MEPQSEQLQRGFGLSTATYVVIASMVGTGILTTSGYIIKDTGSHSTMLGLWVVGGIIAICGALTVAEMAAAMPYAGGEYVYIREAYGKLWAFLYGWVSFVIGFSAAAAIASYGASRYVLGPWLKDGPGAATASTALAAGFVIAFTAVHMRGHSLGAKAQNASTLLKVVVLIAIAVGAFIVGRGQFANVELSWPQGGTPWDKLAHSLVFVMFSYSGWNAATYMAGEIRDPARLLPRALLGGCGAVMALYLLLNLAYAYAMPVGDVAAMSYAQVEPIAATAAERLFGSWTAAPFSVCIGLGLLASLSAFILTGPRVYYAMAQDGSFPAVAGRLNPRTQAPTAALVAQAACTLLLLFTGTFKNILTYAGVGLSISSFFVILAIFVLRVRRPDMPRPFKTPLYPVTPLVFLACTLWMIVFAFRGQPLWSSISLGTILAGVPIYYLLPRRDRRQAGSGLPTAMVEEPKQAAP